jgi:hypothetical protein
MQLRTDGFRHSGCFDHFEKTPWSICTYSLVRYSLSFCVCKLPFVKGPGNGPFPPAFEFFSNTNKGPEALPPVVLPFLVQPKFTNRLLNNCLRYQGIICFYRFHSRIAFAASTVAVSILNVCRSLVGPHSGTRCKT